MILLYREYSLMKTKFMIVASLGLLFALQSQADPIRAGILMGAGVAIGTINKSKMIALLMKNLMRWRLKHLMLIYHFHY